ncbi:MAG: hypothetical protein ACTSU2_06325 [Promethearchaeota archaeon]
MNSLKSNKSNNSEGYVKGAVQTFFKHMVQLLNEVSEDPLNPEYQSRIRVPFFPVSWDISQYYFILKEFFKLGLFDQMGFIITNRDYTSINEIFLIRCDQLEEEEIGTNQARCKFSMINLNEHEHEDLYIELTKYVKAFSPKAYKVLKEYADKEYSWGMGQLFVIPEKIAYLGTLGSTDYINSDLSRYLKDFIRLMRLGFDESSKKLPVIYYSRKELRDNPIVQLLIKFATEWGEYEINKVIDFFSEMADSLIVNLLILNELNKPICICRTLIEDKIIHLNPVPLDFLKDYLISDEKIEIDEITEKLYNNTRIKTIPIKLNDIVNGLKRSTSPGYSLVESSLDILEYIYRGHIYPSSIMKMVINGFGVKCELIMPRIKEILLEFIKYYKSVLFIFLYREKNADEEEASLNVNSDLKEGHSGEDDKGGIIDKVSHKKAQNKFRIDSIFELTINSEGRIVYKSIDKEPYNKYLDPEIPAGRSLYKIEEIISKDLNKNFGLMIGVKLNDFMEIFAIKNLESIIEMMNFVEDFESVKKISEIFKNITENSELEGGMGGKEKEEKKEKNEKESMKKEEPITKEEILLLDIPFINRFLNRGIIIKSNLKDDLIFKQVIKYSDDGYLGMDVDTLKSLIKDRFMKILENIE